MPRNYFAKLPPCQKCATCGEMQKRDSAGTPKCPNCEPRRWYELPPVDKGPVHWTSRLVDGK